jgi:hypothetical protein
LPLGEVVQSDPPSRNALVLAVVVLAAGRKLHKGKTKEALFIFPRLVFLPSVPPSHQHLDRRRSKTL